MGISIVASMKEGMGDSSTWKMCQLDKLNPVISVSSRSLQGFESWKKGVQAVTF